ncbi:Plasminogen [Mizuhopecten yessoensis]|uniref:Plasminogen n=1 Tax=Mizuhopecten yessoensis TaxID=6573 RepID=A0A210QWF3_MIZYE|nr:Plasminogen [Mizuhopecten yessoensis]
MYHYIIAVKDCFEDPVYEGHMTCTETGRTCQRWDEQTPHSHFYYTDRSDYHNYCRISFDTSRPWCMTTDPASRWEYCPVPKC